MLPSGFECINDDIFSVLISVDCGIVLSFSNRFIFLIISRIPLNELYIHQHRNQQVIMLQKILIEYYSNNSWNRYNG